VKKPSHLFETRAAVAVVAEDGPFERPPDDPRAVHVRLRRRDRRVGHVMLSTEYQVADDLALDDPDLPFAVACWVWARGGDRVSLRDGKGRVAVERVIDPARLGMGAAGARRLVSLAPSNAEVLVALELAGRLVGVEDSTDVSLPAGCERLGPDLGPDLDRVAALRPDLVLASLTVPGMERVVTGLRARGLPFEVLAPRGLDAVLADLGRVGALLDAVDEAEAAVARLLETKARIEAMRPPGPPLRVYLEWWPRPMYTPGRACYTNEVLALAGGTNVFGDRPGSSVEIRPDELRAKDPDVCVVSWCGVPAQKLDPAHLGRRPGLDGLRSVQAGRVFAVDEALLGRPGPALFEGALALARRFASIRGRLSEGACGEAVGAPCSRGG